MGLMSGYLDEVLRSTKGQITSPFISCWETEEQKDAKRMTGPPERARVPQGKIKPDREGFISCLLFFSFLFSFKKQQWVSELWWHSWKVSAMHFEKYPFIFWPLPCHTFKQALSYYFCTFLSSVSFPLIPLLHVTISWQKSHCSSAFSLLGQSTRSEAAMEGRGLFCLHFQGGVSIMAGKAGKRRQQVSHLHIGSEEGKWAEGRAGLEHPKTHPVAHFFQLAFTSQRLHNSPKQHHQLEIKYSNAWRDFYIQTPHSHICWVDLEWTLQTIWTYAEAEGPQRWHCKCLSVHQRVGVGLMW